MTSSIIISIRNLNVFYTNNHALKDVNIDFYDDDFVGIIGPNGGGKTTLIKAVLGLVKYSGTITYNHNIKHNQIGYMPQINTFDRNFPITVKELIKSGMQSTKGMHGIYNSKNINIHICKTSDMLSISHLMNRSISELSGGELQRALLCRAIINQPKILILDEPTNFVDNEFEFEFYNHLAELNKNMAIIMVSHDLGIISNVVKSIICVNKTVHRHDTNILEPEMFENYKCPIKMISHGDIPHTVLARHSDK